MLLLSHFGVQNEYELSFYHGDIAANEHYKYIAEHAGGETVATYEKLREICLKNKVASDEISQIEKYQKNEMYEDVTIREDAPHFYSEDSSAPANASADDDGLRPLVRTVRDSNAEKASQTFPGSVITTETTTEYKGDTVIETVTTTETKGDTTVRNTVRTETKNGAVIRKTTSTSTTTVQNLSEDQ